MILQKYVHLSELELQSCTCSAPVINREIRNARAIFLFIYAKSFIRIFESNKLKLEASNIFGTVRSYI